MNSETKTCQNCQADFPIEPEDFQFYERIKVPPPTFCPECRMQRRMLWRNERSLYKRDCGLCGQSTLSMFAPEKDLTTYCRDCWYGDSWDMLVSGRDYDFGRNFFVEFEFT